MGQMTQPTVLQHWRTIRAWDGVSRWEAWDQPTLLVGRWVGAYKRIKYASLRTVMDYYECYQCESRYKLHYIHV